MLGSAPALTCINTVRLRGLFVRNALLRWIKSYIGIGEYLFDLRERSNGR